VGFYGAAVLVEGVSARLERCDFVGNRGQSSAAIASIRSGGLHVEVFTATLAVSHIYCVV
jgi:hypothetical protein